MKGTKFTLSLDTLFGALYVVVLYQAHFFIRPNWGKLTASLDGFETHRKKNTPQKYFHKHVKTTLPPTTAAAHIYIQGR